MRNKKVSLENKVSLNQDIGTKSDIPIAQFESKLSVCEAPNLPDDYLEQSTIIHSSEQELNNRRGVLEITSDSTTDDGSDESSGYLTNSKNDNENFADV